MDWRPWFRRKSWWAKLIGALLGYLIAGPAGALFGILIGNFFDRELVLYFSRPHWSYRTEKRRAVQNIFFKTTFETLGFIAKADGRISERDIQMAKQLMKEMGLRRDQVKLAQTYFNAGKSHTFNIGMALMSLKSAIHDNKELLKLFLDIQYRAAQVDGFAPPTLAAFNTVLNHMGFASLHQQYRFYEDFTSRARSTQQNRPRENAYYQKKDTPYTASNSPLDHAYAVLGISPQTSHQEVKRAYRRLVSRNHSDKLIAKGLLESMIKLANEKTQKISKAYEEICRSKGW